MHSDIINLCLQVKPIISLSAPQHGDMNQWLQVELPQVMKITGIITQGAKSLGTEMYVMSYALMYSNNGLHWSQYTDDERITSKVSCGLFLIPHFVNYVMETCF